MLWSLTPQSLPCRRRVADAVADIDMSSTPAASSNDAADDSQQRSVFSVFCSFFNVDFASRGGKHGYCCVVHCCHFGYIPT